MIVMPSGIPIPETMPTFGSLNWHSRLGGLLKGTRPRVDAGIGEAEAPDARGKMEPLPMKATRPVQIRPTDALSLGDLR